MNDTYGHEVGDAVLSRISSILRECAGRRTYQQDLVAMS
ncbi:diguanylate cyclase [Klebsiella variicola subsp. variicola]|nr:diguanylate cyclase [Klebsiella variicola subsp. variicola]